MSIQDKALQLATDLDLSGNSPNLTMFQAGQTPIDLATDANLIVDIAQGGDVIVEFEVTEAFTGWTSLTVSPYLIMGVALSNTFPFIGTNWNMVATAGWPVGTASGELGMVPEDAAGFGSLQLGDRYYCKVPGGVLGLPYISAFAAPPPAQQRDQDAFPAARFLSAVFMLPNRDGQTFHPLAPPAYNVKNFTAGKISARIVDRQYLTDGLHHYAPGMRVQ